MKLLSIVVVGAMQLTPQDTFGAGSPGQGDQREKSAKVHVKVVNSLTGVALENVRLTLRTGTAGQTIKYTGRSDSEGVALWSNVDPGQYTLYAEKAGFLPQYYGARRARGSGVSLALSEGQVLKDLLFKLTPQGVISGKVIDGAGEPADKVHVMLMQRGYSQGKRLLQPAGGALTNDLGDYRIPNINPGSYYLAARRGSVTTFGLRLTYADVPSAAVVEKPEEDYWDTYYPSSLDPVGATALSVEPGTELRGIDIQLKKIRVFRVQGQVVDAVSGQPAKDSTVALTPSTPVSVLGMGSLGGPQIPGGKFEITGVPPGTYNLIAQVRSNAQTLYARQSLSVVNRNVTDLIITVPQPVDVTGRIRVLERAPPHKDQALRMESVTIALFPAEGFALGSVPHATAEADGSFVLRNVVPDRFQVEISGAPPGWYLKSILVGGQERSDATTDLTGGPLEIVVAGGAAEVSGSALNADDKPVPGAKVTLVPEDASAHGRIGMFRYAIADQNGRFQIAGAVPGSYKIFGWEDIDIGALKDFEFRRQFESKAKSLSLGENGRETVEVKTISADDVEKAGGLINDR